MSDDDIKKILKRARRGDIETFSQRVPSMRRVGSPMDNVSGSATVPTMRAVPFENTPREKAGAGDRSGESKNGSEAVDK